jgi:hypothetical protein
MARLPPARRNWLTRWGVAPTSLGAGGLTVRSGPLLSGKSGIHIPRTGGAKNKKIYYWLILSSRGRVWRASR